MGLDSRMDKKSLHVDARITFLYYSPHTYDLYRGKVMMADSFMTLDFPRAGGRSYLVKGVRNEIGCFSGVDRSFDVEAWWAQIVVDGEFVGLWVEDGEKYLFHLELDL